MTRDKKKGKLGSLDEEDSNASIMVWSMIYSELAGKVSGIRGYFMRIAISKGKTEAQAILRRVKADAAIGNLMEGGMRGRSNDWDESYKKAYMKQEVSRMAAAKITSGANSAASVGV